MKFAVKSLLLLPSSYNDFLFLAMTLERRGLYQNTQKNNTIIFSTIFKRAR
uniref:Uncharacterized protein n=1 Tax=Strongyloides papillosus TaxID=174720 RepID=A0A0N5CEE6_STREA